MEYIKLQHSELKVSRLCMGGCPMGGYGWGDTNEKDFIDAIHTALDLGINFFDTADTYGLGQSEFTLGKGLGNHRNEVVIESKFGVKVSDGKTEYDNSPSYIKQALENTLARLDTSWVDIYTIHYRDGITPLDDVMEALLKLKDDGKIRYFGLSNVNPDELEKLKNYKEYFVNTQEEFSLACRKHEGILKDTAQMLDVNPMSWGSLGQGILTGKYDKDVCFDANDRRSRDVYVNFHGNKLEKNLEIVEALKQIANKYNKSVSATAIRFILDYLPNSIALCGAKNAGQIKANAEALDWALEKDDIILLEKISK